MKIDMSKAYDRVSWIFLLWAMRAFGFGERWCDLIYRLISNYWYSVLWDGSTFGHFKSNQGVRQGDPISPSLFILSMEIFSRMLKSKISDGLISPYFVAPRAMPISHLLYADDILIFSNGQQDSIERLMGSIDIFFSWSGQRLNAAKSFMFFDVNILGDQQAALLQATNFTLASFLPRTWEHLFSPRE
ncbi:unnamed protein product [Rhodiola kirilowii]